MGMEHSVETALGADIQPTVRQSGHDLTRRQGRELRLVARQQDPLALLFGEPVRHQAVAAFTAIKSVPITREQPPPALQRGEPHAQQSGHLTGPCPGGHGGIEDLQGLAAVRRRGQSPSSSPQ
jgi:hypothetical protein